MSENTFAEEDRIAQRNMHKDFFDRCQFAIDHGFYMEAILLEYAAIEARLEVILGMLGAPCNKFLDDNIRKNINISHRIKCLKQFRDSGNLFANTNLSNGYFKKLEKWIDGRNRYIHGLYKSEIKYNARLSGAKEMATKGLEYSRLLYNEAKRIRRLYNNGSIANVQWNTCSTDRCSQSINK